MMALKAATLRPSASVESLLDPVTRAAMAPSSIASARSDKSALSTALSAQDSPSASVNELQLTTSLSDLRCVSFGPSPPPPRRPLALTSEAPSILTAQSLRCRQSRSAAQQKLPPWVCLGQ